MANWCSTEYAFYGQEKAIKDFESKVAKHIEANYVKNGFGPRWLGNVVVGFGGDYEKTECRGYIEYMDSCKTEDNRQYVQISTETAWGPMPEMWEAIINTHYTSEDGTPQISFVYCAEEIGEGIFINTDKEGVFFIDKFHIEMSKEAWEETVYCESFEKVCDIIADFFGTDTINSILGKEEIKTRKDVEVFKSKLDASNTDKSLVVYEFNREEKI